MDEIFRLCDAVTVMRDGQHVATMPLAQTNEEELVKLMIGRSWQKMFPDHIDRAAGPERLRVENFSSPGKFQHINFSIRSGRVGWLGPQRSCAGNFWPRPENFRACFGGWKGVVPAFSA